MEERTMALDDALKQYTGILIDPDASASVTGSCGDKMEFYIKIVDARISEIRYHAEGCGVTQACGAIVCFYADQRPLPEALYVSPGLVLNTLGQVPDDHKHCAILASTTFYKALSDYLLKL
jgi:nitrogen fixation NifU-like protein